MKYPAPGSQSEPHVITPEEMRGGMALPRTHEPDNRWLVIVGWIIVGVTLFGMLAPIVFRNAPLV